MKKLLIVILYLMLLSLTPDKPRVNGTDIEKLVGPRWMGKLTYLDYTTDQKTSILSDLIVTKVVDKAESWVFKNEYPEEPKANGEHIAALTDGGTKFDGETVLSRQILASGEVEIITQKEADGKSYRYTYVIGDKTFSIKKEEKGKTDKAYFERNRYEFKR